MKKQIIKTAHGAIEVLGDGNQAVLCGTHSSGVRYEWPGGLPNDIPTLTRTQVDGVIAALQTKFGTQPLKKIVESTTNVNSTVLTEISEDDWIQLRKALKFMCDKAADNEVWSTVGYALLSLKHSRPIQSLWLEWSQKSAGYTVGAAEAWYDAHSTQAPRSDFRHIFTLARSAGWGRSSDPLAFAPVTTAAVPSDSSEPASDSPPAPERPVVQIVDAALPANIDQMEGLLKPTLFTQGQLLVRLGREHLDDGVTRNKHGLGDPIVLVQARAGWVRKHLTEMATFLRYHVHSAEWRAMSAPPDLVNVLLDQGDWPQLRPLDAIARAPFVREDGSICDVAGYDARSRALYIPSVEFPSIPASPTIGDARAALDRLCDPFDQFPWYTPAARSAFLSHVFTEVARLAIDRAPMFWYSAPNAGTGKGLLSEMAATIVHGTEPAMRPWCSNDDELRKTLFASLLAGDRSIAFDNLPNGHKIRSSGLCAFLTATVWKDRKLGVSETHAVRNRAVVSASGNNVTPVSDLARRSLVVRLDANSAAMQERRFKIPDLRRYVMAHRATLLVDALTIIKAYHATTSIDTVTMPSFERWTKFCCEPLIWLGEPNPRETQKTETDDETGTLEPIFEKLAAAFGARKFGPLDIAKLVGSVVDADGELGALMLNQGCVEPNNALKVGYWLRGIRDQRGGALKIEHAGVDKYGAKWTLKRDNINEDLK
jgi:hypothetical protein